MSLMNILRTSFRKHGSSKQNELFRSTNKICNNEVIFYSINIYVYVKKIKSSRPHWVEV